jgi:isoquinoline 1-oxidoreductase subunit beta
MPEVGVDDACAATNGISRRRFIGYLIAAPTLVAAADLRSAPAAYASVPTVQPVDFYDLTDLLTDAANLTASLITVTIDSDGTASFALPRAEVGQGITTATAMVIADELELPLEKVEITLSDARPELEFNQLTGGSNSMLAQCGYCQPGQIMAAVALVNEFKAEGRQIADADIDLLRNICRCGTYARIREAIVDAAANM